MASVREARSRAGAAVFAAVLLLLSLTALGHGALLLAQRELTASIAGARLAQARAAARAGARQAALALDDPSLDSLAVRGSRALEADRLGPAEVESLARRLSRETWLGTGSGWVGQGPRLRAARVWWRMEPLARTAAFGAVAAVAEGAPVRIAGRVEGAGPTRVRPPLTDPMCAPWAAALDSLVGRAPLPSIARHTVVETAPHLGPMIADTLLARVSVRVSGSGTPGPTVVGDSCDEAAPWGWGDPDRPDAPCGGHLVLRAAPGALVVSGGVGQGVVIVRGDLTLRAGARLYGVLLVGGALTLTEGARVEGLVRADGGVRVDAGAVVRASACWAVRALDAARPELGARLPVPGVGWLGPL